MINLSDNDKKILRNRIKEKTYMISYDKKLRIDKELLESLIFYTRISKNGILAKYPIWTGSFLQKIDLSEISFDNVVWNINEGYDERINIFGEYFETIPIDYLNDQNNKYEINLSKTNAHIDFSKSFDILEKKAGAFINSCNLSEINLENSNIEFVSFILNSDISYSNTKIDLNNHHNLSIYFSNLEGIDLSNNIFQSINLLNKDNNIPIYFCNLKNTKINIICNFSNKSEEEKLLELIINGYLDGCYINGQIINNEIKKKVYNITNL